MTYPATKHTAQARAYAAAWRLAAENRLDLNVLVDYAWPAFLGAADDFVRAVDDDQVPPVPCTPSPLSDYGPVLAYMSIPRCWVSMDAGAVWCTQAGLRTRVRVRVAWLCFACGHQVLPGLAGG